MAKLAGIDLGGWHDAACRNFRPTLEPDETGPTVREIIDGGIGGVVVDMERGGATRTIAGPQAILSPIGRGGGWSNIGAPHLRRSVRALWSALLSGKAEAARTADAAAGVLALAAGAEKILFCVPDRPEMSERPQQMLLRGLTGRGLPRPTLLWRSVAALLDVLDDDHGLRMTAGMTVVVLTHEPDGVALQRFALRRLEAYAPLVPERAAPGRLLWPQWGLDPLLDALTRAVRDANPVYADNDKAETPRLPLSLLLAEPPYELPEIVRRDNGDWLQIDAPPERDIAPDIDPTAVALPAADLVLLASPLATRHRVRLEADIRRAWPGVPVYALDAAAAARGALRAAERIAGNLPHYLDRLDPIALAVLRDDEPVFQDLIPPDAAVPGDREYRSDPITSLMWPAGKTEVDFYILKGGRAVRHWTTAKMAAPNRPQPLTLQLRQTPAQGWATLTVTSSAWEPLRTRPIVLDWNSPELTEDERPPAEILASLRPKPPVVPDPISHAADIGLWDGRLKKQDLVSELRSLDASSMKDFSRLVEILRSPFTIYGTASDGAPVARKVHAIASDGSVPDTAPADDVRRLDTVLSVVAQRMRTAVVERRPLASNDLVLVATWAFGRCPAAVRPLLVDAYFADKAGRPHPLTAPRKASTALIHGLGRCIEDGALAVLLIRSLLDGAPSVDAWGAAGALLSRPATTPQHLRDDDVTEIAHKLVRLFGRIREEQSYAVTLKYALLCAVGLLRVRERLPSALVATSSPIAGALRDEISGIADQIRRHAGKPVPAQKQKLTIMASLIEYLNGTGGDRGLLGQIDQL